MSGNYSIGTHTVIDSSTPPGYNKRHRDVIKLLTAGTAAALATGASALAVVCSAAALLLWKQGTMWSAKNLKWGAVSLVSFAVSLAASCLHHGAAMVDADRAYELQTSLRLKAQICTTAWSAILVLVLLSSYIASSERQLASHDTTPHQSIKKQ